MELILALIMGLVLSIFTVYINQPSQAGDFYLASSQSTSYLEELGRHGLGEIQQVVKENIRGELRKESFETVVEDLKNLTRHYGGRLPYLNMVYENERWKGRLNCKVPTENVTSFTFEVRQLINKHGKVTYITISVTEVEADQTGQLEELLSEVSISLEEFVEGKSPIVSQIEGVIPWLVTSLVWIAQGIIIGVPLCFASLGVILIIDRGIIPVWKKQFKGKES
jgi:hypothetical protein